MVVYMRGFDRLYSRSQPLRQQGIRDWQSLPLPTNSAVKVFAGLFLHHDF